MFIAYILFFLGVAGGTYYLWLAFWGMNYLVGAFWAFIWTFPMPLGITTFPFWARSMYGFSDPNIWFWYWTPFLGIGIGLIYSMAWLYITER